MKKKKDKNLKIITDYVKNEDTDMIAMVVDGNSAITWHRCGDQEDQTFNMINTIIKCTQFDKDSDDEKYKTSKSLFDAVMNVAAYMCAIDKIPLNVFINTVATYKENIAQNVAKMKQEVAEKISE